MAAGKQSAEGSAISVPAHVVHLEHRSELERHSCLAGVFKDYASSKARLIAKAKNQRGHQCFDKPT